MYEGYLIFSVGFTVIHIIAYMFAGMITYNFVHKGHPIYDHYLRKEEEKEWIDILLRLKTGESLKSSRWS